MHGPVFIGCGINDHGDMRPLVITLHVDRDPDRLFRACGKIGILARITVENIMSRLCRGSRSLVASVRLLGLLSVIEESLEEELIKVVSLGGDIEIDNEIVGIVCSLLGISVAPAVFKVVRRGRELNEGLFGVAARLDTPAVLISNGVILYTVDGCLLRKCHFRRRI